MFVCQSLGRFQLNNKSVVHEQIGDVIANEGAVLVVDFEWILLLDVQAQLSQSVRKGILIHLLQVPMFVVAMDGKASFPDHIAQRHNVLHNPACYSFFASFALFRGRIFWIRAADWRRLLYSGGWLSFQLHECLNTLNARQLAQEGCLTLEHSRVLGGWIMPQAFVFEAQIPLIMALLQ